MKRNRDDFRCTVGILTGLLVVAALGGCGENRDDAQIRFFEAVKSGDMDTATSLAEKFPDFVRATDLGLEPSHWAAQYNHAQVLAMLLAKGADINAKTDTGSALTEYAVGENPAKASVMKVLLEKGANVSITDDLGVSLLMSAAHFGNKPLAQVLIESGADVNAKDKTRHGNSVLHHAIEGNNPELVSLLLQKGADPRAKNKHGRTPLKLAMGGEEAKMIEDPSAPGTMTLRFVWVEGRGVEKRKAVIEVLQKHAEQK